MRALSPCAALLLDTQCQGSAPAPAIVVWIVHTCRACSTSCVLVLPMARDGRKESQAKGKRVHLLCTYSISGSSSFPVHAPSSDAGQGGSWLHEQPSSAANGPDGTGDCICIPIGEGIVGVRFVATSAASNKRRFMRCRGAETGRRREEVPSAKMAGWESLTRR